MSLLVVLLVTAACLALGAGLLASCGALPGWRPGDRGSTRVAAVLGGAALALVAGLVASFVLLLALDAAGVPWRRRTLLPAVALALAAVLALAWWRRRGRWESAFLPTTEAPLGWGDGAAAAAVAAFAWGCWHRLTDIPDFVYHWGAKGRRYQEAGGIDYAFLADPLRLTDHPDYPNLLPSLYAATAHLRGFFDERAMLLYSPLFLAVLLLAARTALARGTASPTFRQGGLAAVAFAASAFAIAYRLAGGGDVVLAPALVAALPALLPAAAANRRQTDGDDLRTGVAAALAAAVKIEGVPLALLLMLLRGGMRDEEGRRFAPRRWVRLALPVAAVGVPWFAANLAHGLFQPSNTGAWAGVGVVAGAALEVMGTPEWHGLPWLLLALPALLLVPRLRVAAALLSAQTAFYAFVYLTTPVDARTLVLTSMPRLLFHLLVPALALYAMALAPPSRRPV